MSGDLALQPLPQIVDSPLVDADLHLLGEIEKLREFVKLNEHTFSFGGRLYEPGD